MNRWMKCLYAAIHDLRTTCELRYIRHRNAGISQMVGRTSSRQNLHTEFFDESTGESCNVVFIRYADERALDSH